MSSFTQLAERGICYSATNPRLKIAEPKPLGRGSFCISFHCHRGRVHYGRRTPSSAERRESPALIFPSRHGAGTWTGGNWATDAGQVESDWQSRQELLECHEVRRAAEQIAQHLVLNACH